MEVKNIENVEQPHVNSFVGVETLSRPRRGDRNISCYITIEV